MLKSGARKCVSDHLVGSNEMVVDCEENGVDKLIQKEPYISMYNLLILCNPHIHTSSINKYLLNK